MLRCVLTSVLLLLFVVNHLPAAEPRAARSVHLGWDAPPADAFYLDMTIDQSTPGSYFMACGWDTGYFGLQELGDGKKVVIFSVWDPTKGDDQKAVPLDQRVELLHSDPDVRIRRFGGEGTGGQCMGPFAWKIGETHRFAVRATIEDKKTAYAGYIFRPETQRWRHLVTFRTRTDGKPLRGLYSFIEDFRRDTKSVHDVRRARFGNGWVRVTTGEWKPITQARFTASGAEWEAKDSIDAGTSDGAWFLATGGATKTSTPLKSRIEQPAPANAKPPTLPE
ncbi:MAG: DUF3472 domain-containing protein [Planctomycetales bacterium]|nr:DUF3472 domain-containing protein [Planctomycetales bacterium]